MLMASRPTANALMQSFMPFLLDPPHERGSRKTILLMAFPEW